MDYVACQKLPYGAAAAFVAGCHVVGLVAAYVEKRRVAEKFVHFRNRLFKQLYGPRIAHAPRPPVGFQQFRHFRVASEYRVLAALVCPAGCVPQNSELRNRRNSERIRKIDDSAELGAAKSLVEKRKLGVRFKRESSPGLEHYIIEFVIRRKPHALFELGGRGFRIYAQMHRAEGEGGAVGYFAGLDIVAVAVAPVFRQLPQGF